eukprot:7640334-Pyramimonas_sp.AAC.1
MERCPSPSKAARRRAPIPNPGGVVQDQVQRGMIDGIVLLRRASMEVCRGAHVAFVTAPVEHRGQVAHLAQGRARHTRHSSLVPCGRHEPSPPQGGGLAPYRATQHEESVLALPHGLQALLFNLP